MHTFGRPYLDVKIIFFQTDNPKLILVNNVVTEVTDRKYSVHPEEIPFFQINKIQSLRFSSSSLLIDQSLRIMMNYISSLKSREDIAKIIKIV